MTDERMNLFLATSLTPVGQQLEADEAIRVELIAPADALRMACDGTLDDGKSILALLLASRLGHL
jgi:hypothetical protein